jgi:phospholipid-binding lipoprotein MlaA
MNSIKLLFVCFFAALATGCASVPQGEPNDPLEPMNRGIFAFNEKADEIVLKPVAEGYRAITPGFVRAGVSNFFSNLGEPVNALNNLLQGKPGAAVSDVGRFAMNSSIGILGLWDVATPAGLEKSNEDFGQTLGKWGVESGPYLVLPLMGPSTVRDTLGRVADSPLSPQRYIDRVDVRNTLYVVSIVNTRSELLEAGRLLDTAALDRYTFVRDAWLQRRQNQVYDGKPPKPKDE